MGKRHETIGIKQVIRFEWMQKAANLLLAGLEVSSIRKELHEYIAVQKAGSTELEKSCKTRTFAVNNLMNIWITPDPELVQFRDATLEMLGKNQSVAMAIHWAMISAAYPFWFNVAMQTGRLLSLQEHVSQRQIIYRVREQYGDRETVSRYARYVIRSFVAWGCLRETGEKGCYNKGIVTCIDDTYLTSLLLESTILASGIAKGALVMLLSSPSFFPFSLPYLSGESLSRQNRRVAVERYGLDEELLTLNQQNYREGPICL